MYECLLAENCAYVLHFEGLTQRLTLVNENICKYLSVSQCFESTAPKELDVKKPLENSLYPEVFSSQFSVVDTQEDFAIVGSSIFNLQ